MKKIFNNVSYPFSRKEIYLYKQYALLSYIPFLSLIMLFKKKTSNSKYLLFHVNQGIIITIYSLILFMINNILKLIFNKFIIYIIIYYLMLSILIYLIFYGIINTFNNKSIELPIIGKYNLLKR